MESCIQGLSRPKDIAYQRVVSKYFGWPPSQQATDVGVTFAIDNAVNYYSVAIGSGATEDPNGVRKLKSWDRIQYESFKPQNGIDIPSYDQALIDAGCISLTKLAPWPKPEGVPQDTSQELPQPFIVKGADGTTYVKIFGYHKASTVLIGAAVVGAAIWFATKK